MTFPKALCTSILPDTATCSKGCKRGTAFVEPPHKRRKTRMNSVEPPMHFDFEKHEKTVSRFSIDDQVLGKRKRNKIDSGGVSSSVSSSTPAKKRKKMALPAMTDHSMIKNVAINKKQGETVSQQHKYEQGQQDEEEEDIDVIGLNVESGTRWRTDKNVGKQEEEEEEEEDFDVMGMNEISKNKDKNELKTFGIGNILSNIVSHLSIVEIIKLRSINKLFNNELEFGFECNNFNIFFNYKNKYIIDIIKNEYCNTMEIFTLFYLQSFNIKKCAFGFKKLIDSFSDDDTDTLKNNERCDEKSGLTQKYICSVEIDNKFRDHVKPCPHFDFNVDFDIICKHGNVKMNPFKSLHIEMKIMNDRISQCDLFGNDTIDMLQLCRLYQFKPLKNKLKELVLKNKQFCEFVVKKGRKHVADGWLSYIWQELGFPMDLFSWYFEITTEAEHVQLPGKPAFFADSAAFGNFDVYHAFIESLNDDIMEIRSFSLATSSIFGMFALFLRYDLAINYVHHDDVFFYAPETLAFVIQPQCTVLSKKYLVRNCMFVLDKEAEWEFNVLENPRYHPNERIKFLKMLTNSTKFAQGLLHDVFPSKSLSYTGLAKIIERLLNFDTFKIDWMLDGYSDLKGNDEKQRQLYESCKYYIQFLFGIGSFYVDLTQRSEPTNAPRRSNNKTIIEANTNGICDSSGLNIGNPIDNGFKFFDLSDDMIKSDRDLQFFVDTLKQSGENCDIECIMDDLVYPQLNWSLDGWRETAVDDDDVIPKLKFDQVTDIYQFLRRKWNYR